MADLILFIIIRQAAYGRDTVIERIPVMHLDYLIRMVDMDSPFYDLGKGMG